MENNHALIAGATGLVGKHLLDMLLQTAEYDKVYVLTRRPLGLNDPKVEELVIDFDELLDSESEVSLPEVRDVFCCLGTTMKKAGSKKAFRKVDYNYPLELATRAAKGGASHYLIVSALGAKKNSFFFYNKVKGEVEEDISKIAAYKAVSIFRPSLILGEREENRRGEGTAKVLMRLFSPVMKGPLRKYRAIHARSIAKGMLNAARNQQQRGVHIYESEEIKSLAGEIQLC